VSEYGLGGAFFWRLGGEDPRIWPTAREELQ
jgi:spore germination protein YaaH